MNLILIWTRRKRRRERRMGNDMEKGGEDKEREVNL
jgi:hypothetical protein